MDPVHSLIKGDEDYQAVDAHDRDERAADPSDCGYQIVDPSDCHDQAADPRDCGDAQNAISGDCDNCMVCAASSTAHSWKNSGKSLWENTLQKGKSTARCVHQRFYEYTQRFQEAHPTTAEYIGKTSENIRIMSQIAFCRGVTGVQCVRGFVKENSIWFYFCGATSLIVATFFYLMSTYSSTPSNVLLFSLWLVSMGGFLMWVPVYYWMYGSGPPPEFYHQTVEHEQVTMEKPPEYESLPPLFSPPDQTPAEAPPTYEEMLQNSPGLQAQLPHSGAVCVGVPLCPVHQAGSEHQDTRTQRTRDSAPVRSKSLVNLYESDRDSLVHLV